MFSSDMLAQMIRFYGNAMQGMMGKYLENNIQAFTDMQKKLQDQAKHLYGDNASMSKELWAQFLNFQGPAMQSMMGAYVEQSRRCSSRCRTRCRNRPANCSAASSSPPIPCPASLPRMGPAKRSSGAVAQ